MAWLETFRQETAQVIEEPFFRCLAEAIATVESDHGRQAIASDQGINEIGYKAVPGYPSCRMRTREAGEGGRLEPTTAQFRLFRDRLEQARSLLWLVRSSQFYEAARLLFVLTFYSAYAPGRTDGAHALIKVFNEIAGSGAHAGVRPLAMTRPAETDPSVLQLNHAAARQAVRLFAELTGAPTPNAEA